MKMLKAIGHYLFIRSTGFTLPAFVLAGLSGMWIGQGELGMAAIATLASLVVNAFGDHKQ